MIPRPVCIIHQFCPSLRSYRNHATAPTLASYARVLFLGRFSSFERVMERNRSAIVECGANHCKLCICFVELHNSLHILMFVEYNIPLQRRQLKTHAAVLTTTGAYNRIGRHSRLGTVIHPGDVEPCSIELQPRPSAEDHCDVLRPFDCFCNFVLFCEGQKTSIRSVGNYIAPHFSVFFGHEVACNMDPEETRLTLGKVGAQLRFQFQNVFLSKLSVFIPRILGLRI